VATDFEGTAYLNWEYKIEKMQLFSLGSESDLVRDDVCLNDLGKRGGRRYLGGPNEPLDANGIDTLVLFKRPISK
jgi:hypothetical protein